MKIWRCVCVSFLLLLMASGCSSFVPRELLAKNTSESFCLVLARTPEWPVIHLPIKIDDYVVKLKRGSFLELELSPGMHFISDQRGLVGSSFPPATTNVSGSPGERRYFLYVMQYTTVDFITVSYPYAFWETSMKKPIHAAWKEITPQEFEDLFPHAKFNH